MEAPDDSQATQSWPNRTAKEGRCLLDYRCCRASRNCCTAMACHDRSNPEGKTEFFSDLPDVDLSVCRQMPVTVWFAKPTCRTALAIAAYPGLLPESRPKLPDQSEDRARAGKAGKPWGTIAMQHLSTPWLSAVLLVPACAIVVGGAEHRDARTAEFRVNSDLVVLPLSITNRAGRSVLALSPVTSLSPKMA